MRNFLSGFALGIVSLPAAFLVLAMMGRLPVVATENSPRWERRLLQFSLERSLSRQVPELKNPVAPTEENLLAGMKTFRNGCAGCHGEADKRSRWGTEEFYPRVPQFGFEPPTLSEGQMFWVIKNGIRYSGMGGNGGPEGYSDEQIWKVASFLSRLNALPRNVAAEWHKPVS
jgi:mono/diheme cytochrome c family protein